MIQSSINNDQMPFPPTIPCILLLCMFTSLVFNIPSSHIRSGNIILEVVILYNLAVMHEMFVCNDKILKFLTNLLGTINILRHQGMWGRAR
jgi:hypothetical protein